MTDNVNDNNPVSSGVNNNNKKSHHDNKEKNPPPPPPPNYHHHHPVVSVLEFGVHDSIQTMVTLLQEAALPEFTDVQVVTFRDILALHPRVVAALVQLFRCVPRRRFLQVELTNCCCSCSFYENGSGNAADIVTGSRSHKNHEYDYDDQENQLLVSLLASAILWADNVRGLTLEAPFLTEGMILTLATALQCNCPTLVLNLNANFCSEEEDINNNDDNNDDSAAADDSPTTDDDHVVVARSPTMAQVLGQSFRHNTTLQTLDLTGCHWDPTSVQQLALGLCGNAHLQTLRLSNGQLPDDDLAFFLSTVFQSSTVSSTVSSSSASSSPPPPTTARTSRFQLRDLNLSGNGARRKTIQVLSQLLLQSSDILPLAQLDLSDQHIIFVLPHSHHHLQKVPEGERTLDMVPLFEALYNNVSLTHLNVSGNAPFPIDSHCDDDDDNKKKDHINNNRCYCPIPMTELAKVLQQNTTLTHLVLSSNCISDQELKEMAVGWKTNSTLELVDLQHNDITDQGILNEIVPIITRAAATAARTPKPAGISSSGSSGGGGLHTLYLAGNNFLATGAQAVLAASTLGRIQTDIVNVWTGGK